MMQTTKIKQDIIFYRKKRTVFFDINLNTKVIVSFFFILFSLLSFSQGANAAHNSSFYVGGLYGRPYNYTNKNDLIITNSYFSYHAGFDISPLISFSLLYTPKTLIKGILPVAGSTDATPLYNISDMGAEIMIFPRADRDVGAWLDWQPFIKFAVNKVTFDPLPNPITDNTGAPVPVFLTEGGTPLAKTSVFSYTVGVGIQIPILRLFRVNVIAETKNIQKAHGFLFWNPKKGDASLYQLTLGVDIAIPFNETSPERNYNSEPLNCPLSLTREPKFCMPPEEP